MKRFDSGESVAAGSTDRASESSVEGEVRTYAGGRQRSVTTVGLRQEYGFTLRDVVLADLTKLESWAGSTVQVRNNFAQRFIGVYFKVGASEPFKTPTFDVDIELHVVTV